MGSVLLSIIVPVFNVEKYVDECIRSIISNGFDGKCELILVDDGSTDCSGKICDSYATTNITIIHKTNGGLSSAKNAGIECACGKYLAFIDSDDYIGKNSIISILSEIEKDENIDVFFMQGDKVYTDGEEITLGDNIYSESINGKAKSEVISYLAKQNKFAGSACTKIYKREFLEKYAIRFPDDKRFGEDLIFVLKSMYYASSYGAMNFPYYKYRQQRKGSITNTLSEKAYWDGFRFLEDAVLLLTEDKKAKDENSRLCMSFITYEYSLQVWHYTHIKEDSRKRASKLLDQYRWVMRYSVSKKTKAISMLIYFLGYKRTSQILSYVKITVDKRKKDEGCYYNIASCL